MKHNTLTNLARLAGALLFMLALTGMAGCTSGLGAPTIYRYSMQWNVSTDAPVYGKTEVKVLDYSYGVKDKFEIEPVKWARDRFPKDGCCNLTAQGMVAPRGDYIYFKWRIIATGEVFEDFGKLCKTPSDVCLM